MTSPESGPPHFSWAVHTHHLFTFVLCALGTTLPPWVEDEGAIGVMLGEAGSLWITITQLFPTPLNFKLRYYLFFVTRVACVFIAFDMVRQIDSAIVRAIFMIMAIFLSGQNWTTLMRMRDNAIASTAKAQPQSVSKSWPL